MRGSIKKRYEGSWSLILELGYQPDPKTGAMKRKQKWITFKGNQRQAEKKLAELVNAHNNNELVEPSKLTVREWLLEWVEKAIKPPKKPASTYAIYLRTINNCHHPEHLRERAAQHGAGCREATRGAAPRLTANQIANEPIRTGQYRPHASAYSASTARSCDKVQRRCHQRIRHAPTPVPSAHRLRRRVLACGPADRTAAGHTAGSHRRAAGGRAAGWRSRRTARQVAGRRR